MTEYDDSFDDDYAGREGGMKQTQIDKSNSNTTTGVPTWTRELNGKYQELNIFAKPMSQVLFH